MSSIDLRNFVLTRTGYWTDASQLETSFQPGRLTLRTVGDKVTLKGPLSVRITRNVEYPADPCAGGKTPNVLTKSSHMISIPAGQSFTYTFSEEDRAVAADPDKDRVAVAIEPLTAATTGRMTAQPHYLMMADGSLTSVNAGGFSTTAPGVSGVASPVFPVGVSSCDTVPPIIWDPFFPPYAPGYGPAASPCSQPASNGQQPALTLLTDSGGGQPQDAGGTLRLLAMTAMRPNQQAAYVPRFIMTGGAEDVPCDFAVSELQNAGQFFPSACEQCPPGSVVNIPPGKTPGIKVRTADGGCVRPRFFNGQFITKEDLETLVRWSKLKDQLHNRAAGQGVVWGFDVARDGQYIAVRPGYGVDCCGHDLTINKTYCVDVSALLCDPAAAPILSRPGRQCLHLLLEYYECHEQPRPVHGDQCSNDRSQCDMSRTRETVRLRLVPPREYEPDGPIGAFLREVEALKSDPAYRLLIERAETLAAQPKAVQPPDEVPYTVEIGLQAPGADISWVSFRPSTTVETTETNPLYGVLSPGTPLPDNIHIRISADTGRNLLSSGPVTGPDGNPMTPVSGSGQTARWVIDNSIIPITTDVNNPTSRQGTLAIAELKIGTGDAAAPRIVSSPVITLTTELLEYDFGPGSSYNLLVKAALPPVVLSVEQPDQPLPPLPCLFSTCGAGDRPLFPVMPPWIHADPFRPGEPADPKVLVLAIVHNWLMMEITRHHVGTPDQVVTPKLRNIMQIYGVLLNALFGAEDLASATQISQLLHRLLCAWCKGFLYPGPRCHGTLHGVVIGSVTVEAGNIADINPWGGRRYVVHYPLLAHWGEQLGILPLDVMVSRVMSMVCCVAGLPFPAVSGFDKPGETGNMVDVGSARLSLADAGAPVEAAAVVRSETLTHAEFVARAARSLASPPSAQPAAGYVRYELSGVPEIALFVPEAAAAAAPDAGAAADARKNARIVRMADPVMKKVPPLMEDLVQELSSEMLDAAPVAIPDDSPLRDGLSRSGLLTTGRMLRYSATELHKKILKGADPKALTEMLRANDKITADITAVVADVVGKFSAEKDVVTAEELTGEANLAEFSKTMAAAVKRRRGIAIPPELAAFITRHAVKRVAGRAA